MSLDSLHDLYVEELKDLYNAENQLLKALPRMAKAATAPELKAAFTEHLEVTRTQVERLEQIFEGLEVSPKGKKCKAMEGLVEEGKEILGEGGDPAGGCLPGPLLVCSLLSVARSSTDSTGSTPVPPPPRRSKFSNSTPNKHGY